METTTTSPPDAPLGLVVLGRDEAGRPHASRFEPGEAELATRAAGLMRFAVLPISETVAPLVQKLPKGKLFSSGKGFVPFVKAEVYEALNKCEGVVTPPAPEPAEPAAAPAPAKKGKGGKKAAKANASAAPAEEPAEPAHRPTSWDDVKVGSLVLASEGVARGWWECEVVEDRGDDQLVVKWWDFPDEAPFPRRRDQLALTPPTLVEVI